MTSVLLIFLGNPQLGGAAPDVPQAVVIVPHCLSHIILESGSDTARSCIASWLPRSHYLRK